MKVELTKEDASIVKQALVSLAKSPRVSEQEMIIVLGVSRKFEQSLETDENKPKSAKK